MFSKSSIRPFTILAGFVLCVPGSSAQIVARAQPVSSRAEVSVPSGPVGVTPLPITAGSSQYALGAADIIHVSVWKSPDLSQTVTVGPDGFVSLPLLGDVHVAGLTTNQLAQNLSSKLSAYVVSAQVTVSVVEIRSRLVFVTGQVGKPGAYSLIAPITVLQLIAQAGGLTTFANRKSILILRTVNSKIQRLRFNYTSALSGDMKQNINLQPGDTVVIP
ncbi:polysaccharide biosynthesis/export family protein [Edaphobacter paludis]|uniref:Polysaccharide biosynthesis/export family protein n=1 Tax=Edaphobacter paludis TaxID=3035702 RepID=A0AAU7CV73_9BACT